MALGPTGTGSPTSSLSLGGAIGSQKPAQAPITEVKVGGPSECDAAVQMANDQNKLNGGTGILSSLPLPDVVCTYDVGAGGGKGGSGK